MIKIISCFSLFSFLCIYGEAQSIVRSEIDASAAESVTLHEAKHIYKTQDGKQYAIGTMKYRDENNQTHNPFFISDNAGIASLFEEKNGFAFNPMQVFAMAEDAYQSLYVVGSFNSIPFVCKLNSNLGIEWTRRQGHHAFYDIQIKNDTLYLLSQDENTEGKHTSLVSRVTLDGAFIDGIQLNSGYFDTPCQLLSSDSGLLIISRTDRGGTAGKGVFVAELDNQLSFVRATSIITEGEYYNPTSAAYKNDELHIIGLKYNIDTLNTTFCLTLNDSLQVTDFKEIGDTINDVTPISMSTSWSDGIITLQIKGSESILGALFLPLNDLPIAQTITRSLYGGENLIPHDAIVDEDTIYYLSNTDAISTLQLSQAVSASACTEEHALISRDLLFETNNVVFREGYDGDLKDFPFIRSSIELNHTYTNCANTAVQLVQKSLPFYLYDRTLIFEEEIEFFAITDLSGRNIYQNRIKRSSFNLNHLPSGFYVLTAQNGARTINQSIWLQ